jgi:hypothetical protein
VDNVVLPVDSAGVVQWFETMRSQLRGDLHEHDEPQLEAQP